jgi:hypothetical protein
MEQDRLLVRERNVDVKRNQNRSNRDLRSVQESMPKKGQRLYGDPRF